MRQRSKDKKQKQNKGNNPMQPYANLYLKHKDELFAMMEEAEGEPLPKDINHGEAIALYIDLLKNNEEFAVKAEQKINEYNYAIDPFTAAAEAIGTIAGTVGIFKEGANQEAYMEAQQDMLLYQTILQGEKSSKTSTILIVTGLSLAAVIGLILIIKKNK